MQTVSCACDTVLVLRCSPFTYLTRSLILQISVELPLSTRLSSRLQRHHLCPHRIYSLTRHSAWLTEDCNGESAGSREETDRCKDSSADTKQCVGVAGEDFRVTSGLGLGSWVGSLWEQETGCGLGGAGRKEYPTQRGQN